jgi:hypothetical protein
MLEPQPNIYDEPNFDPDHVKTGNRGFYVGRDENSVKFRFLPVDYEYTTRHLHKEYDLIKIPITSIPLEKFLSASKSRTHEMLKYVNNSTYLKPSQKIMHSLLASDKNENRGIGTDSVARTLMPGINSIDINEIDEYLD